VTPLTFFYQYQFSDRDPRRSQPLVDWILALPLEFNGDSAFASKLNEVRLVELTEMNISEQEHRYVERPYTEPRCAV
jgi:hypothetical protein